MSFLKDNPKLQMAVFWLAAIIWPYLTMFTLFALDKTVVSNLETLWSDSIFEKLIGLPLPIIIQVVVGYILTFILFYFLPVSSRSRAIQMVLLLFSHAALIFIFMFTNMSR